MSAPDSEDTAITVASAVDAWLVLLLAASIGGVLFLAARVVAQAPLQAVGALVLAFVGSSVVLMRGVPCYYTLTADALLVRGGIQTWKVPFSQIEQVDRIWSVQGAAAWSARRLRIRHRHGSEQISPKHLDAFEQTLRLRLSQLPQSEPAQQLAN